MADVTESRKRAWAGADRRHNMSLSPEARNSRENELLDHYSVGADLGPVVGSALGVAQEVVGRPLLSRYPDLANQLAPSVFNFKTSSNDRPGAIDPYTKPTLDESAINLASTLSGALDQYPWAQRALGLTQEETLGGTAPPKPATEPGLLEALMKMYAGYR